MNKSKKSATERLKNLQNALVDDVLKLSDEEVMMIEDNPDKSIQEVREMINKQIKKFRG